MLALVTGGAGFIGSHIVDRLIARGIRVRIFDMVVPTVPTTAEFYHGSLLDAEALRMAMNSVDVVYHLAAVADVKDVYDDPAYGESINVRGTINVLEAARRAKVGGVIYGSTTWVYSTVADEEVDEQTPLAPPAHLYTATKIASEYYCQSYSALYHLPVTILRYGIPYGPRARDAGVVPMFVRKAMRGEPLTIAGDGSQFRKFVYVEDLAEGNVLALKTIARNKIYNLDGTEKVTIRQIAEAVQRIARPVPIEYGPPRPGDFSGKEISSQLAKRELSWEPRVGFEEGLRRYFEWWRAREATREAERERLDTLLTQDPTGER